MANPLRSGVELYKRWSLWHALVTVALVAGVVRLLAVGSLPLVISNDSAAGYLLWGESIADGHFAEIGLPKYRTPGYPLLIGATFALFGVGAIGLLIVQHLLGLAACLALTALANRLAGPRMATVAGLLTALDHWLLGFESAALTEAPATCLLIFVAALALGPRRPRVLPAFGLGAAIGVLLLVRPTFQIMIPFTLAAWLVGTWAGWRRSLVGGVAVVVGLAVTLGPWVHYRMRLYDEGPCLASGSGGVFWMGISRQNLLSLERMPDDPEIRADYAPFVGKQMTDLDLQTFYLKHAEDRKKAGVLRDWAMDSVVEHPGPYLQACLKTAGILLNYNRECSPGNLPSELDWFVQWAATGGPEGDGITIAGPPDSVRRFSVTHRPSAFGRLLRWWSVHQIGGIPQIPVFAMTVLWILLSLFRRQWHIVIFLGGTIAFLLVHSALLAMYGRYMMPLCVLWYTSVAGLPGSFMMMLRRRREARKQRAAATASPMAEEAPVSDPV